MTEAVLEIGVTEFKAKCSGLLTALEKRSYKKVVVTRRGKPVAELTPPIIEEPDIYGCMAGRVRIGPGVDLTQPVLEVVPDVERGIVHR
jgi:antitoxin (DNA-binding transcriptional repressor) of toxin-antitoxin stability system